MAREDLYVALTRGRHANRLYVATDLIDDDCPPGITGSSPGHRLSARQVLDRILATTHTEPSATETWAAFHPLDDAPVPPPGRLGTQSPRYIAQLEAVGVVQPQRVSSAPVHRHRPAASPAHVIERPGL